DRDAGHPELLRRPVFGAGVAFPEDFKGVPKVQRQAQSIKSGPEISGRRGHLHRHLTVHRESSLSAFTSVASRRRSTACIVASTVCTPLPTAMALSGSLRPWPVNTQTTRLAAGTFPSLLALINPAREAALAGSQKMPSVSANAW